MNIQRKNVLITGYSLVLMTLVAGFAIGYAFPKFYDKNSLETLPQLLTANTGLYRQMLGALWLIVILDILVSWTLYRFFKPDNRRLSVVSLILRLVYTLLFGVAICYLFANSAGVMDPVEINNNYSTIRIRCLSVEAIANFSSTSFTLFFSKISSSERLKLNSSLAGREEK